MKSNDLLTIFWISMFSCFDFTSAFGIDLDEAIAIQLKIAKSVDKANNFAATGHLNEAFKYYDLACSDAKEALPARFAEDICNKLELRKRNTPGPYTIKLQDEPARSETDEVADLIKGPGGEKKTINGIDDRSPIDIGSSSASVSPIDGGSEENQSSGKTYPRAPRVPDSTASASVIIDFTNALLDGLSAVKSGGNYGGSNGPADPAIRGKVGGGLSGTYR